MRKTRCVQFVTAVMLLVAGIFLARGARATSGWCPQSETGAGEISPCDNTVPRTQPWGNSCSFENSFVLTGTSQGVNVMDVNLGDNNFDCVQGVGFERVTINGITSVDWVCANYDDTNDGQSVSDTSGDCNAAVEFSSTFFYRSPT